MQPQCVNCHSTEDALSNQVANKSLAYIVKLSANCLQTSCQQNAELGNRAKTGISVLQHWQDTALTHECTFDLPDLDICSLEYTYGHATAAPSRRS